MNATILFFPFRFGVMAVATAARLPYRAVSAPAAALYAALVAALCIGAFVQTDLYHAAFPTGRGRSTLTLGEIVGYVGAPALYPLPPLALAAMRRRWGCVSAVVLTLFLTPLGFTAHVSERLALDLYCLPTSLAVQPTALLHLGTGVAMAAAMVQARAMDME